MKKWIIIIIAIVIFAGILFFLTYEPRQSETVTLARTLIKIGQKISSANEIQIVRLTDLSDYLNTNDQPINGRIVSINREQIDQLFKNYTYIPRQEAEWKWFGVIKGTTSENNFIVISADLQFFEFLDVPVFCKIATENRPLLEQLLKQ